MTVLALDTSVAVPLVVASHAAHRAVSRWWGGRDVSLCGHAAVETYSVLTRLPGDLRLAPIDAARLLGERFGSPLLLGLRSGRQVVETLSRLDITGGAAYDALVALAALEHGADLATRDERARPTYERVGVRVVVAA